MIIVPFSAEGPTDTVTRAHLKAEIDEWALVIKAAEQYAD